MSDYTTPAFNWPESARLLYENAGDASLHFKVKEFLTDSGCKRVLVACSGGADSVFMLSQLWAHAEELGIRLIVAHYDHRWRGEDSISDAKFVEEMSHKLACPFVTEARPESEAAATETSARDLRLAFLRAAAKKQACQCIAFGHQQDDILETQLQRLARGSGTDGLAAPRPVHFFEKYPTHIRPLLHLRASAIREALKKCSIVWCEDASNKNVEIPRNALRRFVIPELQSVLTHDVAKGAARSRELFEEDAIALDQLAGEFCAEAFEGSELLGRNMLRSVPRALARRALVAWLNAHNLSASLSAQAIEQLIDTIYTEKETCRLSAGASFIKVDAATIRIESAGLTDLSLQSCSIRAGESVVLSTDAKLSTMIVTIDEELRETILNGAVDLNNEAYIATVPEQILQIRARRPGDTYRPLGSPGTKKLKDCFIDRKIPAKERNLLPLVVTSSGTIAWVPGLPPADDLKISATTKTALKLTYEYRNSI